VQEADSGDLVPRRDGTRCRRGRTNPCAVGNQENVADVVGVDPEEEQGGLVHRSSRVPEDESGREQSGRQGQERPAGVESQQRSVERDTGDVDRGRDRDLEGAPRRSGAGQRRGEVDPLLVDRGDRCPDVSSGGLAVAVCIEQLPCEVCARSLSC